MINLTLNEIQMVDGGMSKEGSHRWEDIGCTAGSSGTNCSFTLGQAFDGFNDLGVTIGNALYDLFN